MKTDLPKRIALLVEAAGGQRPLARLLGVADGTIIGWLGGSEPYQRTLMQIAERMGVSLEWLRDGQGDEAAELANFTARVDESQSSRIMEEPGTTAAMSGAMEPAPSHCRRLIEHITRNLSTEHFTEAQLRVMQDAAISPGERERIAQHMAAVLADRLSAKHQKHQTKN